MYLDSDVNWRIPTGYYSGNPAVYQSLESLGLVKKSEVPSTPSTPSGGAFHNFIFTELHNGRYLGSLNDYLSDTFTVGKDLMIIISGMGNKTNVIWDGNLPTAVTHSLYASVYIWENNPYSKLKLRVKVAGSGTNHKGIYIER